MNYNKRKFISTPLGVADRERLGASQEQMKEQLFGRRMLQSQSLFRRDLLGHFGCVNAIEFSTDGRFITSGGDDRRLLLWNIHQTIFNDKPPTVIDTLHISNINTCCFDADNKRVSTGGNDGQVIVHDFCVQQSTAVYGLSDAVYCLSPDPVNASIMAIASDDGKAQLLDTRMSIDTAPFVLADLGSAMHSVVYNPAEPRLLATANSKHGIGLWDIRMPLKSINDKSSLPNCMSVRFNSRGDQLLALRRRSCPVLYDIGKMHPLFEFDYKTYYNACTLKSCAFAGQKDEFVMSGSDDFCVYLWKIPTDISDSYTQSEPQMILKGHRSIVNQVRYCPCNQTIISSGVEKLIKLWSPYYIPGCIGRLVHSRRYGDDDEVERNAYSHEEYIHMVLQAGSFLSHDYTNGTTEEEPCMIAFFDSLIQREVEQSIEDDDDDDDSSDDGSEEILRNSSTRTSGGTHEHSSSSSHDNSLSNNTIGHHSPTHHDGSLSNGTRDCRDNSLSNGTQDRPDNSLSNGTRRHRSPTSHEDSLSNVSRDGENSSLRAMYADLLSSSSSSDSEGEVDVILSAMYRRYISSRENAGSCDTRTKKISNVIARSKHRHTSSSMRSKRYKMKKLQDSHPHTLITHDSSMSLLADIMDTFVETQGGVSSDNVNNGDVTVVGRSSRPSTPVEVVQQTLTLEAGEAASMSSHHSASRSRVLQPHITGQDPLELAPSLESGMYFMPELQAFAPDSFNAIINLSEAAEVNATQQQRQRDDGAQCGERCVSDVEHASEYSCEMMPETTAFNNSSNVCQQQASLLASAPPPPSNTTTTSSNNNIIITPDTHSKHKQSTTRHKHYNHRHQPSQTAANTKHSNQYHHHHESAASTKHNTHHHHHTTSSSSSKQSTHGQIVCSSQKTCHFSKYNNTKSFTTKKVSMNGNDSLSSASHTSQLSVDDNTCPNTDAEPNLRHPIRLHHVSTDNQQPIIEAEPSLRHPIRLHHVSTDNQQPIIETEPNLRHPISIDELSTEEQQPITVKFKKVRVKGKNFRIHQSASSDDDDDT